MLWTLLIKRMYLNINVLSKEDGELAATALMITELTYLSPSQMGPSSEQRGRPCCSPGIATTVLRV